MYSTSVFTYVPRQLVVLLSGNSVRKYMPQYSKPLTLHRGVDNRIQFQFLNQEQRPNDITGKSITCRILNYDGSEILLSKALDIDLALTGIASLNLNAAEIENIPAQKAYYTLEIQEGNLGYPVFIDQNAAARGDLNIVNSILPSFVPSSLITIPTGQAFPNLSNNQSNTSTYYSSLINTEDNPVLTIQTTYSEFEGNITIQGSTIVDGDWYDIVTENYSNISDTQGYTIKGYHPYVRLEFESNNGMVTEILAR